MLEQRNSDNDDSECEIPSSNESRPHPIQKRPRSLKSTNLLKSSKVGSGIEEPELVQVYLRVKPCKIPNSLYEVRSDKCLVTSLDITTAGHSRRTQQNGSKMYTFSKIFSAESNQKEIFEQVVKDNLKKLPEGHNFTLLTYGASGSGKTFTYMGTVRSPGLVPRSLEYVFKLVNAAQQPVYKPTLNGVEQLSHVEQDFELQLVKRLRHVSALHRDKYRRMSVQLDSDFTVSSIDLSNRGQHYVWVSFVEIYNDGIYDLLAPPKKRTKLLIREDSTSGNVYVKGATQAFVRSGEEAYDVMGAGKHNLSVAATRVHAHSSRSHCIFTITMLTETDEAGAPRTSTVRLCDLAGCEPSTRNTGARMLESRAINSSLHVLQRCLHMLRHKQRSGQDALVPYRESKLTRLLGTGLSGTRGEAVHIVVTLNPSPEYAHETKHILRFAEVAQDIQVKNTMLSSSVECSPPNTTRSCSTDVEKLRLENERLQSELLQAQARNEELMAAMEKLQLDTINTVWELVEKGHEPLAKALQTEVKLKNREKEVQHLRSCIEERNYSEAFRGTTPDQEVIVLSDSKHEKDEDESLELVFRTDLNKLTRIDTESIHTTYIVEENEEVDDEIL